MTISPVGAVSPLQEVVVRGATGATLVVTDALEREYFRAPVQPEVSFRAGGACGIHKVRTLDPNGREVEQEHFRLRAETRLKDEDGEFADLLYMCLCSISGWESVVPWRGRIFKLFVHWFRDNTHALKATRYFESRVTDSIDLYRMSQREDGMFWDFLVQGDDDQHFWQSIYAPHGFYRADEDGITGWVRMPVENDVEYLFAEAVYYAWQATGDDEWMRQNLDAAIRGLEYSLNNPLRFSQKFQLLKRGYTIDTWDFLSDFDKIEEVGLLISDQTRFGVMFGDNTGYAMSCERLAQMLEHLGRNEEASRYRHRAQAIRERLEQVAWRGTHYQHHVPEDPDFRRDFGVDDTQQVSLSNAYSLNRNIPHENCVAIIRTYQRLREQLPQGSPGEWYMIYPPFLRGWERHAPVWEYMNSGVSPIVAGELAHGAFEHGFEAYAADILRRVRELAKRSGHRVRFCYRGGGFEAPQRTLTSCDIRQWVNMSYRVPPEAGRLAWMNGSDPGNDLSAVPTGRHVFEDIPFDIADGCVGISTRGGMAQWELPVRTRVGSVYLLHTVNQPGSTGVCGKLTFVYEDGTQHSEHIVAKTNVWGWVFPQKPSQDARVAWTGRNRKWTNVGVVVTGINSPHPDRMLSKLVFEAEPSTGTWAVLGVTLSDSRVYFPPDIVSFGGPDEWAAAAIAYALLEGLAGVKDRRTAFRHTMLSPRWTATGQKQVEVCAHYPASDAYVAYRYQHAPEKKEIELWLTGSGDETEVRVLLPKGAKGLRIERVGNSSAQGPHARQALALHFDNLRVEDSAYVRFRIAFPAPCCVRIVYG